MSIRYFDMFAGIGGFRSGLEVAGGFECVGYCEINRYAKQAYESLYQTKGELYYEDATKINPGQLPDFDLLLAGFPCQPYPEKKNIPKLKKKVRKYGIFQQKFRDKFFS